MFEREDEITVTNGALEKNASPGQSKEDSEVLRDLARRCRTLGSAVVGADRQRILEYALRLEKIAANSDEASARVVSGRRRSGLSR
jgi:hypothetical protein